jgi:hypothetical protein
MQVVNFHFGHQFLFLDNPSDYFLISDQHLGLISHHVMIRHFQNIDIRTFLLPSFLIVLTSHVFAQTFTHVNTPAITPLTNARAQWADFNNDNLLDLFVSGTQQNGSLQTRIYFSNGDNTFNILDLPPPTDIDFALGDYNRDSFIDILIQGMDDTYQKHTRIFRNEGGVGFALENFSFTPLSKGGVLWHDLDHDTDLDIIISGLDESLEEVTIVYEWRNGNYFLKASDLVAVSNGRIKSIDVERDGRPEVLLTGLDASGVPRANLYSVNDSLEFTLLENSLPGSAFNSISVNDMNGDGYDDFIVSGLAGATFEHATQVFLNNAVGDFVLVSTSMISLEASSVTTADFNHDGQSDVILTGHDQSGLNHSKYYANDGSLTFSDITTSLPVIVNGETAVGDYDNDGDLDIFLIGNSDIDLHAAIYSSDQASLAVNVSPEVPSNLSAMSIDNTVTLSWSASQDEHTPSVAYNIYVSRNAAGTNMIVAPNVDMSANQARLPGYTNVGYSTSIQLTSLPEGQYYWSVQAVDNSFISSGFSEQQTFSICHSINIGSDTAVCYNENISLEAGSAPDVVNWYSRTNGPLLSASQSFTQEVQLTDTLIVHVVKPFGCFVRDTIVITVIPLPMVSLGEDRQICFQQELTLEVPNEIDSVNWISIDDQLLKQNSHEYTLSVLEETIIIAQVFSELYHCANYDTVTVSALTLPIVSLGEDRQVCYRDSVVLSIEDQSSLNWRTLQSNTELQSSVNFVFEALQSDTVMAELVDERGCRGYDSLTIEILPLPSAFIGNDTTICFNENILLEFSGSQGQLQWTNHNDQVVSDNVDQFLHHVVETDTIQIRITDENNCINYDFIIIDVLPLPIFDIGIDTAICSNEHILLKAGVGFQRVDWYSTVKAQNILTDSWYVNYRVVNADTIISYVVSADGCSGYDSIRIERLDIPVIDLGADRSICAKDSVVLEIAGSWTRDLGKR